MIIYPLPFVGPDRWLRIRLGRITRRGQLVLAGLHDLLYVATDLTIVTIPAGLAWQCPNYLDLVQDGRAYRYLGAHWYAWLFARVEQAGRLATQGRLNHADLATIEARFAVIQAWAHRYLPAHVARQAEGRYRLPSDYVPPAPPRSATAA